MFVYCRLHLQLAGYRPPIRSPALGLGGFLWSSSSSVGLLGRVMGRGNHGAALTVWPPRCSINCFYGCVVHVCCANGAPAVVAVLRRSRPSHGGLWLEITQVVVLGVLPSCLLHHGEAFGAFTPGGQGAVATSGMLRHPPCASIVSLSGNVLPSSLVSLFCVWIKYDIVLVRYSCNFGLGVSSVYGLDASTMVCT